MQDSLYLSLGLACVYGAEYCDAGQIAPLKPRTTAAGRATVAKSNTSKATASSQGKLPTQLPTKIGRPATRVIRAQSEAEMSEFDAEPIVPVVATEVIPAPAVSGQPDSPDTQQVDAIQKLRDRSAKARWDDLHQEWLRARKKRQSETETEPSQPPAAEQPVEGSATEEKPFTAETPRAEPTTVPRSATTDAVSNDEHVPGKGVTAPRIPSGRVFLQSQQNDIQPLPGETEAQAKERRRLELEAEEALKVPPAIRDPNAMPKISEIDPNPIDWALPAGRPVPDVDAKRYIKLGGTPYIPRTFERYDYHFAATDVYSNPLYFEDPQLERYGHTLPPLIQPIASVARFGGQLVLFPYQVAMKPFAAKIYPLGWYGPGEYTPYRLYQLPLNAKAAAAEVGTILGVGYATP